MARLCAYVCVNMLKFSGKNVNNTHTHTHTHTHTIPTQSPELSLLDKIVQHAPAIRPIHTPFRHSFKLGGTKF
jgi:hypothetical protein